MSKDKFSFYKEHPKTCAPDDYWGQVKRTVNGVPVSQDQIDMIVDAVVVGLELTEEDTLLDLCCGNGALSTLFFKFCNGGLGVDFSEHLISVAIENFIDSPAVSYELHDVVDFCKNPVGLDKFSKMVCYGSFSYLEPNRAEELLRLLKSNFPKLQRVFIGNCPDKNLLTNFFSGREVVPGIENDPDSPIGVWRTQKDFVLLAKRFGWQASFRKMPAQYYSSHYRYDVVLSHE
tara:strand:+ start:1174 stop:1869 length:696 start_codon:yes stop_codon:yes gene_type:complete